MTFDEFVFKHGDIVHHKADDLCRGVVVGRSIFQDENGSLQKVYLVSVPGFGVVDALEIELSGEASGGKR